MNTYLTPAWKLFYLQVVAHIGLVYYIFTATAQEWMITIPIYVFVSWFGLVVFYHRYLAHKSWPINKFTYYLGCIAGSYAGIGSPLEWTAIHRAHHRFVDTDRDPHGPGHLGFWRVQFLGMFASTANMMTYASFCADLIRSKFHKHLTKNYYRYHCAIILALAIIDFRLLLAAYLAPVAMCWQFGSFVNSANHTWGYKNSNTRHNARNFWLTALIFYGEGWHDNHHSWPTDYTTKRNWWEFDISAVLIKLIRSRKDERFVPF